METQITVSDPAALAELLAGGARTVATVDEQFGELKQAVFGFLSSYSARERGYFTPSEDERVRQLLISYWHSRSALFEVVTALRELVESTGPLRPRVFLVGYAGALVLIDAARFLREQFHGFPLIRQKLNEPEPHFGIPGDVYDTVQKSLTRPIHIWHLYHASLYYQEHRAELAAAAREDAESARMLEIIDRLASRLSISVADYATARLRVRVREAWTSLERDLFFYAMYGLQKLAGSVVANIYVRPGHRPALPPEIVAQLRERIAPGDVLVTRKEFALTNYFLPGYWPHAAMFLGQIDELERRGLSKHQHFERRWPKLLACDAQERGRVLEAMKDGVLVRSLRSPCGTDSVVVLRPQLDPMLINEALTRGMFHEGKCYDFGFDFTRSDRLVCTEVVYRSYEGLGPVKFTLLPRAGRMTLAAEDLVNMALRSEHFRVAAVYARPHGENLLVDSAAEDVVHQIMTSRGM
jgi:hypothetical protein